MDDLISRAAAIDALVEELAYKPEGYWDSGLNQYDVEVVLNQQPSVDAVEVVRCRDCEHYFTSDMERAKNHGAECTMMNRRTMPEDYCSYGQKM